MYEIPVRAVYEPVYEPVYTCKAVAVRSLWQTVRRGEVIDEWVVRYQHFGHLSEICRICSALESRQNWLFPSCVPHLARVPGTCAPT